MPTNTVAGRAVAPNRSVLSLRVSTVDCQSVSGAGLSDAGRPSMPARCTRSPHVVTALRDAMTEGTGSPSMARMRRRRSATASAASRLPCSVQCVSVFRKGGEVEAWSVGDRSSTGTPDASSSAAQSRTRLSSAGGRRKPPRCARSMRLLSGTTTTSSAMRLAASAREISETVAARSRAFAVRSGWTRSSSSRKSQPSSPCFTSAPRSRSSSQLASRW
nr:hypothetical protein [Variovorax sp. E3]